MYSNMLLYTISSQRLLRFSMLRRQNLLVLTHRSGFQFHDNIERNAVYCQKSIGKGNVIVPNLENTEDAAGLLN